MYFCTQSTNKRFPGAVVDRAEPAGLDTGVAVVRCITFSLLPMGRRYDNWLCLNTQCRVKLCNTQPVVFFYVPAVIQIV